jgi:predicted RNA-binding Zn-ribbon protein involved in translation (DUF1610 family)
MKYTPDALAAAVAASTSIAGVLRHLGVKPTGGSHAHLSRRIKRLGLDTSHFTGRAHNKGQISPRRLTWAEILVARPPGSARAKPHLLRRALIESGVPYRCTECGLAGSWNGRPLTLHVDHIDGRSDDCRPFNLRFLCPNCHSQTATWAGANRFGTRLRLDAPRADAG